MCEMLFVSHFLQAQWCRTLSKHYIYVWAFQKRKYWWFWWQWQQWRRRRGGGVGGSGGSRGASASVNKKSHDCIGAVPHLLIVGLEPLTQQKAENKNLLISFMIFTNSSLWQVLNQKHCLI